MKSKKTRLKNPPLKESVEVVEIVDDLHNRMDRMTEWERKFVHSMRRSIYGESCIGIIGVSSTLWSDEHQKLIEIWSKRI